MEFNPDRNTELDQRADELMDEIRTDIGTGFAFINGQMVSDPDHFVDYLKALYRNGESVAVVAYPFAMELYAIDLELADTKDEFSAWADKVFQLVPSDDWDE